MVIYFYSPREQPYGCLSNFSRHGILMDDTWWPTVEHYFQAQKFVGTEYEDAVRQAKSATKAKGMGRSRKYKLRRDWEQVRDSIMREAVLAKFTQHAELRTILLGTGDAIIVENSPTDDYWGCGATGHGKNKLGKILMSVREELRGR